MAIRFYKNGTTGETDGTEISTDGTFSNPILADGFYPAAGVSLTKDITVHVRADAGETWRMVFIKVCSRTQQVNNTADSNTGHMHIVGYGSEGSFPDLPYADYQFNRIIHYALMPNVNTPITLRAIANGDEMESPDMSIKLAIVGGLRVS